MPFSFRACIVLTALCTLIITGCPPTVKTTVPDVVGMTQADASVELANAGLSIGTITEVFDNSAIGMVLQQTPDAGTEQDEGTSVALTLSKGIEVPDLAGLLRQLAINALTDAGLVPDESEAASATVPPGKVISQTVTAGSGVEPGATIGYTLSLGNALRVKKSTAAVEDDQDGLAWRSRPLMNSRKP